MTIIKLCKIVFNLVYDIDIGHLPSTNIFRELIKGTRRDIDRNIDDTSIIDISAFICDDIKQFSSLDSRIYLLFDMRITHFQSVCYVSYGSDVSYVKSISGYFI